MKKIVLSLWAIAVIAVAGLLVFGPTIVDRQLKKMIGHSPYRVSDEAQVLHDSLMIGDWHADSLLWNRDLRQQHDCVCVDPPLACVSTRQASNTIELSD